MIPNKILSNPEDKSFCLADTSKLSSTIDIVSLTNLHALGFKLIPLAEDSKTPNIKSTNDIYADPSFWTPEKIEEENYRFKNVATTFGKTHVKDEQEKNLFLNECDIDSKEAFDRLAIVRAKDKEHFFIDELCKITFVIKTKKKHGYRFFWLSHEQHKSIGTKDCKPGYEFEIKTDNKLGHSTLPPSRHRDDPNFCYQSIGQDTLATRDDMYDGLLKILKDCLKTRQVRNIQNEPSFGPINGDDTAQIVFSDEDIQTICDSILPYYEKGCKCRHDILFGLSGLLYKAHVTIESATKLVEVLAKDDEEVKSRIITLQGTYKKDPRKVSGISHLFSTFEYVTGDSQKPRSILHKIFQTINNRSSESDKEIDYVITLTDTLLKEFTFKTLRDTDEIFYYDIEKGIYVEGGEWLIKEECEILHPKVQSYKVQEVINHIKRRTGVNRSKFDSDSPDILNLKNGLLDIQTGEFREHSPDYLSLVQLPISYDDTAKCPNILKFLAQVLHPQDVFTALQLFGYCLYKNCEYEKAVMLFGPGSNGKGVFIKLVEAFVGLENTSHAPLQDLDKDKYATADLYCKMANTFADLKAEKLSTTGMFKTLVSGDSIRSQRKYGQPFSFRNRAKLFFSANKIPDSDDKSYAYYRRWVILAFEKVFEGEIKDTKLINKLATPEELSGLLNLALIALKQLHKNGGFKDVAVEKIRKEYEINANTVKAFLDDKCAVDLTAPEYYTLTTNVYNEYLLACKEKGEKPLDMNVFGKELAKQGIEKNRIRIGRGLKENYYLGIKLRSEIRGQNQELT